MANALVPIGELRLPAHLAERQRRTNIAPQETVPSLSFGSKIWTVNVGGETTQIMREVDGESTPAGVFRVVILDWAKEQGRALYAKVEDGVFRLTPWDPKKPAKPLCYSDDGVSADASIKAEPFDGWTGKCSSCSMAVKGSRTNGNGAAVGVACAKHRMIAVIPHNQLNGTPLRMKLATTSDFDGRSPDLAAQGWFAFSNFIRDLRLKGYGDTAEFVTKMKFDPNVTYPKVMFHYDRWLSEGEDAVVAPLAESHFVKNLLAGTWTPAGADGVRKAPEPEDDENDEITATVVAPEPHAVTPKPQVEKPVQPARIMPKPPVAKPATAVTQAQVRVPMDEDEDEATPPVRTAPKAAAAKVVLRAAPVKASREIPQDLNDILNRWEPQSAAGGEDDE